MRRLLVAACVMLLISTGSATTLTSQRAQTVPVVGAAAIANSSSVFPYTYNPSWFQSPSKPRGCLLVRVQNVTSADNPSPGPSSMALSCIETAADADGLLSFTSITEKDVVFAPETPQEVRGTEDPRIKQVGSTYYLFYTAVEVATNGNWIARLSLATTTDPADANGWKRHGALFPDVNGFQFTKSAALLYDDENPNATPYLIFGDCTLYQGLQVAVASSDLLTYTVLEDFLLIEKRPNMFDSYLVESGPPPMKLDDGNWLFIYNAAQNLQGVPNHLFYSPGYVILNGTNPLDVLQRSDTPLVMPMHWWETEGLTPFVIFLEALRYTNESETRNEFMAYYGAADTSIGALKISVSTDGNSHRVTASVL
jgi:predicted GH43/DUF377 family glycosyl hydrolase